MPRYFVELSYKGNNYAGFQEQQNANTIQAEVTRAFEIYYKRKFELTGSSRTDAGVHAKQNFFHFDSEELNISADKTLKQDIYHLNAILPREVVLKKIIPVKDEAHCRFDAVAREYRYYIYTQKDPFLEDRAYFFPYTIDFESMKNAAHVIMQFQNFTSFSKKNTHVKTFSCLIMGSEWLQQDDLLIYRVKANRFLRGMVRGLVGTMLQVGRGKISLDEFREIIRSEDQSRVDFSTPGHGLFLEKVLFDAHYFIK